MTDQQHPDGGIIYCPDVRVGGSRRVTIPSPQRDEIGLGHGDHIDMILQCDGEDVEVSKARVDGRYRATIPKRTCERYGIEEGDYVDVTAAKADE